MQEGIFVMVVVLLIWYSSKSISDFNEYYRELKRVEIERYVIDSGIEKKVEKLKSIINDDEIFNMNMDLMRNRILISFEKKLFYSKEDVLRAIDICVTEEILKRKSSLK